VGITNEVVTNLNPMKINLITSAKLLVPCCDGYLIIVYLHNPRTFMVKNSNVIMFSKWENKMKCDISAYTVMED
jgi:hypothetical protein